MPCPALPPCPPDPLPPAPCTCTAPYPAAAPDWVSDWINGFLVGAMAVFSAEILLNLLCR